jgi:hypothetical protein
MIMISLPGQIPSAEEATARMAIVELLNCHSRALDRLDASLMKAVYWPTATVDYGGFKGEALTKGANDGQDPSWDHFALNTDAATPR